MPDNWPVGEAKRKKRKKLGVAVTCGRVGVVIRDQRDVHLHRNSAGNSKLLKLPSDRKLGEIELPENNSTEVTDDKGLVAPSTEAIREQKIETYISTIEAFEAALNQWPWFMVNVFNRPRQVQFVQDPPPLHYPVLHKSDHQNRCKACQNSRTFFGNVEHHYSRLLRDFKKGHGNPTKELAKFFKTMIKLANRHKSHELQEFAEYVLELSGKKYKEDHLYKVEFERWKRLQKYVGYMFSKKAKMETRYANRLGDTRAVYSKKSWKILNLHTHEGIRLQRHCEKNIEKAIVFQQIERIKNDPQMFSECLLCTENIYVNRLSNAVAMTLWLQSQLKEYQKISDTDSSMAPDPEEESSTREMELMNYRGLSRRHILLCNTRRRHWNKVKPRLPLKISHLFVFGSCRSMENIHPSWFRTLMNPSKVAEEYNQLLHSNNDLERRIETLEKGMQHIEMVRRLKTHMEEELYKVPRQK